MPSVKQGMAGNITLFSQHTMETRNPLDLGTTLDNTFLVFYPRFALA